MGSSRNCQRWRPCGPNVLPAAFSILHPQDVDTRQARVHRARSVVGHGTRKRTKVVVNLAAKQLTRQCTSSGRAALRRNQVNIARTSEQRAKVSVKIIDCLESPLDAAYRISDQLECNIGAPPGRKIAATASRTLSTPARQLRLADNPHKCRSRVAPSTAFRKRFSRVSSSDCMTAKSISPACGTAVEFSSARSKIMSASSSVPFAFRCSRMRESAPAASLSAPSPAAFAASAVATMCLQKPRSAGMPGKSNRR